MCVCVCVLIIPWNPNPNIQLPTRLYLRVYNLSISKARLNIIFHKFACNIFISNYPVWHHLLSNTRIGNLRLPSSSPPQPLPTTFPPGNHQVCGFYHLKSPQVLDITHSLVHHHAHPSNFNTLHLSSESSTHPISSPQSSLGPLLKCKCATACLETFSGPAPPSLHLGITLPSVLAIPVAWTEILATPY